jgi:uncharacterized DUF497 family protein
VNGFEWDEEKDEGNIEKHGIPLAAGIPVFDDDYRLEYHDTRHDYGEDRFITIGYNGYTDVLYVCYTMRGHGKTRLISVRPATKHERRTYEKNTRW